MVELVERIYRLERDEEVMFLIGIKSGDLFFETRIGSVEMRQAGKHRSAITTGAYVQ